MKRNEQILEVACRLFVARGYESVSIDEIGRAAGVSGPAVYRHFAAKTDILVVLCGQALDCLVAMTGPRRPDPIAELTALIDGQVRLALEQPGLVRVYESEERSLPDAPRREIRRRQRAHVTRWVDVLEHFHPGQDRAHLEILAFGAIGLLLSAPRWPRTVRANPAFTRIISAAVWRCVGLDPPKLEPSWDDEAA